MPRSYGIRREPGEEPLFLHEIDRLRDPGARVLDLGSGPGSFDYSGYAATIVGLDLEPGPCGAGRQTQVQGDAAALPFAPSVFDLIVANFTFEHFEQPDRVLAEVQRTLKAGGLLYVALPNSASLEDRLFTRLSGGGYHVQHYSFASLLASVYSRTALKLVSFAHWPAGYTWLRGPFAGKWPRRAALSLLRRCRTLLRARARPDTGFVLLFRKEERTGFRTVTDVCASCGGGAAVDVGEEEWECEQCHAVNPRASRPA